MPYMVNLLGCLDVQLYKGGRWMLYFHLTNVLHQNLVLAGCYGLLLFVKHSAISNIYSLMTISYSIVMSTFPSSASSMWRKQLHFCIWHWSCSFYGYKTPFPLSFSSTNVELHPLTLNNSLIGHVFFFFFVRHAPLSRQCCLSWQMHFLLILVRLPLATIMLVLCVCVDPLGYIARAAITSF